MEVKMSHNEDDKRSEIRFILSGEERDMEGQIWSMIFGAGQKPETRAEYLLNHLKDLVEREKERKAAEKAAQKAAPPA